METKESATAVVIPAGLRVLIGLLWGLVQMAIVFVLLFAGGVAAAYLGQGMAGGRPASSTAVLVGLAVGVAAGLFVNHKARIWLQEFRLRRLRADGVSVEATVRRLDRQYIPYKVGTTSYVAHVQWQDPATGRGWQGERRYRFSGRGSRQLEGICAHGERVGLYYPAHRPARFVLDIPFAPTMADLVG